MRLCSTLMEAGALPPAVKRSLSRSIIGNDINFWGKPVVKSALVEVILALLSGVDDDTLIFLQKVVVHPDDSIRRSVLRTLPLGENEHIRNMLVSHLKDDTPEVRIEVLDRIVQENAGVRLAATHRVGELAVGDLAVVVAASAAHRAEAFAACRLAIDRIKETVPIWKKEWDPDGEAVWVNLG